MTSRWFHRAGGWVLFVMMGLSMVDVFLRYVFNQPVPGGMELSEYMMVILIAFSLPYTGLIKRHITVDLIISRFSPRVQAIVNSITTMASLCFFSVVTWQSGLYVKATVHSGWKSPMLGIPTFPFVGVVTISCGMLCLVFLADLLKSVYEAIKK